MLSGIHEFNIYGFGIKHHTVRSLDFTDFVFAKIEGFGGSLAVFTGRDGCYYLTFGVSGSAVKGDYILYCDYFIHCTFQAFDFIHRLIDAILFYHRGEDFAELRDGDCSFLRVVGLNHSYEFSRSVYLEGYGSAVKHISEAGVLLDDFVIAIRECIRKHELSACIGVVDFDVHRSGIVDVLNHIFTSVGVTNLETDTRSRDNLSGFRVLLHDFNFSFKGGIVNEVTIGFAILIDSHVKCRHKLFAFKSFGLLYSVYTIRQPFGSFGIAIHIGHEQGSFDFSCILIGSCTLEEHLKNCIFFRMLNLCRAIISMLDNCDFAEDDIFVYIHILRV